MENKNQLVKFNNFITNPKTQEYISKVLGERKEEFLANIVSLVANDTNLQECTPNTLLFSAIKSTALNLPLDNNLGFAYVLPYRNKKTGMADAQFQLGYKGFIQLAMRSGQFRTINVTDVRDGEISNINRLTGEIEFNWLDDNERNKKDIIGYVAYFKLNNGFEKSLYMTIEQLKKHGQKYSKSYNTSFSNWKNMFEAMASKTVLKLLLSKYAPLNISLQDAILVDQAVIEKENQYHYIDNDNIIDIDNVSKEKEKKRILHFISKCKTIKELNKLKEQMSPDILIEFDKEIVEKEKKLSK